MKTKSANQDLKFKRCFYLNPVSNLKCIVRPLTGRKILLKLILILPTKYSRNV